jgi:hypothetical protein
MTISATTFADEIDFYSGLQHDNHIKNVEINRKERDKLIQDGHALELVQAKKDLILSEFISIIQVLKEFTATQMVDTVVAESVVSDAAQASAPAAAPDAAPAAAQASAPAAAPAAAQISAPAPHLSIPASHAASPAHSPTAALSTLLVSEAIEPIEPIVGRSPKRYQTVAAPQRAAKAPRWLASGYKLTRESLDNLRKLPQGPIRERMVRYGFVQ